MTPYVQKAIWDGTILANVLLWYTFVQAVC
jgi:hypothetical protein